jgi:sigma-B regulation protein RsbU (phosphoserine phosphatase)
VPARLKSIYSKLGRVEKAFIIVFLLYGVLYFEARGSGFTALTGFLVYAIGLIVIIRLARLGIRKAIWSLRNRLIVTYLFIAVVPIALIVTLAGISLYVLTGQIAVYLVSSELERRTAALNAPAQYLAQALEEERREAQKRLLPLMRQHFPGLELLIQGSETPRSPETSTLPAPPQAWKDTSGIIVKDSRLYGWAHAAGAGAKVTVMAPLTREFLAEMVPHLGDVLFLEFSSRRRPEPRLVQERLPAPYNALDISVSWISPIPVAVWDVPEKAESGLLLVNTRPSAVLGIVFGQRVDWAQGILLVFVLVAGLFLIVELVSLFIGVSLTRTITGAVHALYEGTKKVREGEFSHRIAVQGNDQLAELGRSFNHMTENLERLIVVEKEKERLQSELEIAHEVQSQLFPKNVPTLKSVELTGVCNPARMVSGDYYDFLCLKDAALALAIGDVAGKGISAALLMAAIQSTMRTQLSAGIPAVAAAGNPGGHSAPSTAYLVSHLNQQLYANTAPEKYATFYFGVYDETTSTLTYTNAGHVPPILLRDGTLEHLAVTGTVVGAFPFASYEERDVALRSGDLLVAYTDGIVEPENEYGEAFGDERFQELLLKHRQEDSGEIISRVMEAVRQWTGTSELQDDMTMLLLRRL